MTDPTNPRSVQPPSTLLMGDTGSGKTFAITTLIEAGLEVFVIITEPNGLDSLLDAMREKKLSLDKLHWHTVTAAAPGWDALEQMATQVNTMSYAQISELKQGIAKSDMKSWYQLLQACKNFKCARTGQDYGDVTTWPPTRALVIDSLSGLNKMAKEYSAGLKPNLHQGEWGTAMALEQNLLYKLCSDRHCFFVLTAHLDRSLDEVAQTTRLTLKALGNKLWPEIVKDFSEIVLAERGKDKNTFTWSTANKDAVVKNRALSMGSALPPSFKPLVEAYKKRLEQE